MVLEHEDADDDGDGVSDEIDVFQLDPNECGYGWDGLVIMLIPMMTTTSR